MWIKGFRDIRSTGFLSEYMGMNYYIEYWNQFPTSGQDPEYGNQSKSAELMFNLPRRLSLASLLFKLTSSSQHQWASHRWFAGPDFYFFLWPNSFFFVLFCFLPAPLQSSWRKQYHIQIIIMIPKQTNKK